MPNSAGVEVARISVKVSPNTKEFRRELKSDLEEIERTMKGDIEINGHLDAAQAKADFRRMMMQLKTEAARGVRVPVDVTVDRDRRGGLLGGLLGGGGGGLGDLGNEADRASSQVQHLGKSFLGMSRMAWMATGIIAIAAPAVGLISGLLAGLPSLIGAFGAGAGAIALGMDGIKAAAQTLTPALDAMKAGVSSVFETGLKPQFQQLLGIMPMLQTGMEGVASGMVSMFQGVTDALTTGAGPGMLENFLGNTKGFFEQLQPVANQFTQSFLTLANSGSNAFGYLTGSLNTFSTQFNDMVNRVANNGVMDGAMQGLSQTLDGVTSMFTRLMESGLQAMGQLGGPLNTFLGGLTDLGVALMPALTSLSGLLGNVLGTLGTQLAPIVTALTPAFQTLASTLGTMLTGALQALGPILTQVATLIGTTLNTALQALQPMLPSLMQSFQQISDVLVTSLAPHIPTLATALGQVVGAVAQLAPTIITTLVPAFVQLVPKIAELVPSIVSLAQSFANMMPTILPLAQALISVAGAAIQVGVSIGGALIGAMANLVEIITNVIAKVAEWVGSFSSGAQQIAAKAAELPGMIQSALANLMQIGLEAGKNLVQGLINGIGGMISSAVAKAKELASSVADGVKNFLGIHSPSKLFTEFGEYTAQGFGNGMEAGFKPVIERAKELAAELSKAMESGTDPSLILGKVNQADLKQMLAALEEERKRLKVEKNGIPKGDKAGREALQNQLDQIQAQKDILSYQRDRIKNESEYGDVAGDDPLVKAASGLMSAPVDFAKATGKQFLSDIGISGDGFISKAITEGIQYIFQIGSVDEALSIKDREERKSAMSIVGPR
ncbi:tail length tape measure protein [Mycobacterium phage Serenity]|uniref:tail length tape measure protein n=1 Tax=Mycobacterium phage Serenity TaxID=1701853 RepID=UPI0006CE3BB3|nr:tail length tape measure protein [Mycobacterium phage Serenity]ALF00893.1 tape measure protein [Mycobacterium phage Serenity]